MDRDGKALVKRYDNQWSADANWRVQWQDIADYIIPRVSNILAASVSGEKLTTRLYDAAGCKAHSDLSSALASSMTNMATKWFGLKMRNKSLNDMRDVREWLDECEDIMYPALYQSNFVAQVNEFWDLLSAFGSASIFVEERNGNFGAFNGLRFKTLSPASYVVFENSEGYVDTIMAKFKMSLRAAVQEFGVENLSEKSQDRFIANPDESIDVLHAIYPKADKDEGYGPHAFLGCYVEYGAKWKIREDGYFEFPSPTVRWKKDGSEVWGRGPAHIALPDVKTLNTAVRLRLKSWAKQADPPYLQLDDAVIGTPNLRAGGLVVGRTKDALTPLVNGARIDFAIQQEDRLENKIRNTFYADRITLPNKQYMTAFEVAALREQMQTLLGPTTGRIEDEGLTPLIQRVFGLMYRAGEFPPPPEAILDTTVGTGKPAVDVHYEGPLAKAQRSSGIAAVQTTLQTIAPIAQVDPTVVDNFDFDETARGVAEMTGLPAKFLRDKRKVEEKRAQRAQAQQAQVEHQAMLDQSQMARNLTPAIKVAEDSRQEDQAQGFAPVGSSAGT